MKLRLDAVGCCRPNPGGQAAFAADWTHRHVALEGGWGSGKTWVGARKLLTLHLHNAFDAAGRATYIRHAVVAPTYRSAMDVHVPALIEACQDAGLTCQWRHVGCELVLPDLGTRARPSCIMVRSADMPGRIAGWEVGGAWGDEAARWKSDRANPLGDAYLQLTGRVRAPKANLLQLMLTYTNEGDGTRVYEEFHAGRADHALYRASTAENLAVSDFFELQRRVLTEELKRQYLDGEAISLRGQRVYATFDDARHVHDGLTLRDDLPLHLAVDFNICPGMHAEIGQYDESRDLLTVVHEIHGPALDVRGLVQQLCRWIAGQGGFQWPELQVFGDASGAGRWAGTGQSCYEILAAALESMDIRPRFRVPKANPFVVDRVNAMNLAMLDLSGGVHWQCHSRCRRLIEDLRQLRRDDLGEIDTRDRRLSHASDAEGYRVAYLRPAGRLTVRPGGRFSVS